MNNQHYDQNWQQHQQGQYGYPPAGQYQPARQPMIVIPQPSQEDLMQFYNPQHQYTNQQASFPQPFPGQAPRYETSQQHFNYGNRHPQAQQMQMQQQMQHMQQPYQVHPQSQYNHHMYQDSQASGQQFTRHPAHHAFNHEPASVPTPLFQHDRTASSQVQPRIRHSQTAEQPSSVSDAQGKRQSLPSSQPTMSTASQSPATHSVRQAQFESRKVKTPQVIIPTKPKSAAASFAEAFAPATKPAPPKSPAPKVEAPARQQINVHPLEPSKSLPKVAVAKNLDGLSNDEGDQRLVLLALAEQYITSARAMTSSLALSSPNTDLAQYQDLMTTGLRCLAAAIEQWKVGETRSLVRLRLQYATLLFEETESDDIAQTQLSHGITACERSKLLDQKYSMQHLLARIRFRTKPKAAFKVIDSALEDLVAYQNTTWIYVFRFLRTTLALQLPRNTEMQPTLHNLKQLIALAESRRDVTIVVMAHILEAIVHLRSGSVELIEQSRRAIATARSYQLDANVEKLPQLKGLILFTDFCCDLAAGSLEQMEGKIADLGSFVDSIGANGKVWSSSAFFLPTSTNGSESLLEDTSGILRTTSDGKMAITFRWLNKIEVFMLSFFLCGVSALQRNCMDARAEHYISEGINYAAKETINTSNKSLEAARESAAREQSLTLTMHAYRILACAIRSNWTVCNTRFKELQEQFSQTTRDTHAQFLQYLDGVIKQGTGDLAGAFAAYDTPELRVPMPLTTKLSDLEIRLLATMNRVVILKSSASTNVEGQALLDQIFPICERHHNHGIQAAAKLLQATPNPTIPVIQLKQYLQQSLHVAQRLRNQQLKTMLLNVMNVRFFAGIVGEQASKSSTTAWQLARQMRSPLWVAVSGQNLANSHVLHGRHDEARQAQQEANSAFSNVPKRVQKHFET